MIRSVEEIIRPIAEKHGVSLQELGGTSTLRAIVIARHEAMWALAQELRRPGVARWSLPQIGWLIANDARMPFDHTSVLHGIARHRERVEAAASGQPMAKTHRQRGRPQPSRARGTPYASTQVDWADDGGGA